MKKRNSLYLEERIGLARVLVNTKTSVFNVKFTSHHDRLRFRQLMLDIISVLDGDQFGNVRTRRRLRTQ